MNLLSSTSIFSFFTLISRILGYVRDILIAIFLGASIYADAFFVAFRLPNTFRRLFAEGAFSQAFIPVLGEIKSVQAIATNQTRGFGVEDTSVALLNFSSGVVGSISISDTIVSPWSYELTSNENPIYHHTTQNCYWIGGTDGSIELPKGTFWSHKGDKSWWAPISSTATVNRQSNPLFNQINNFVNVIQGNEKPVVSGLEGLKTSAVIEAIKLATLSGGLEKPKF